MPGDFTHSGGFHLRIPLLSFDLFLSCGCDLTAARVEGDGLDAALDADRAVQRQRFRAIVASRELRDALFIASPDLDDAIEIWLAEPESERGQRVERALVKYVSRAAGRPTPFGLFAGTAVGRIGDTTDLTFDGRERCIRHSRLDMDYLFALADAIARDPIARAGFTLKPNSTVYERAGQVRYVEARLANEERKYHLVAVQSSAPLSKVLARAASGTPFVELAVCGFPRALARHSPSGDRSPVRAACARPDAAAARARTRRFQRAR